MEQKEIVDKLWKNVDDISNNTCYIKGIADIYNVFSYCEANRISDIPYTKDMFFTLYYFQQMAANRIRDDARKMCSLCNALTDNE